MTASFVLPRRVSFLGTVGASQRELLGVKRSTKGECEGSDQQQTSAEMIYNFLNFINA